MSTERLRALVERWRERAGSFDITRGDSEVEAAYYGCADELLAALEAPAAVPVDPSAVGGSMASARLTVEQVLRAHHGIIWDEQEKDVLNRGRNKGWTELTEALNDALAANEPTPLVGPEKGREAVAPPDDGYQPEGCRCDRCYSPFCPVHGDRK
jgi:hypothetical protein